MKLNKRIVIIIMGLMSAALIGLVTVQILLLLQAVEVTTQTFTRNVNGALASVAEKLETRETLNHVLKMTMNTTSDSLRRIGMFAYAGGDSSVKQTRMLLFKTTKDNPQVQLDGDRIVFRLDKSLKVRLSSLDGNGKEISVFFDEIKPAGSHAILLNELNITKDQMLQLTLDSTAYNVFFRQTPESLLPIDPLGNLDRRLLVDKVMEQAFRFLPGSIEDRVDADVLDSIIAVTLQEFGLPSACVYGILSAENDSVIITKPDHLTEQLRISPFRIRLFPHDVFASTSDLVLHFPNQRWLLLRAAGPSAVVTLIFILVIIACFSVVLRILFDQRRFSELLGDFINNMTHEFKTPISSITLAGETLTRSEVMTDRKRLKKYGRMICDESARMRKQVEKILEMAALEKGDVELNRTDVNVHALILETETNFNIRVKRAKGMIHTDLQASFPTVHGDALHLGNILYNLLDNAVNYTKGSPDIRIHTRNETNGIRISVQDNGIGLSSDQQKRVFDKYYRVPTGNVHDVKGFGLGLSYVKLMVEAHGGTIDVRSSPGKGSVFEMILPTRVSQC